MNETTAAIGNSAVTTSTNSAVDTLSTLTTVHFALMALLALLVIAGLVYGARIAHRRRVAEREVVEHAQEAGVLPAEPDAVASPAPPPLGDVEDVRSATPPLADVPIAAVAPLEASPQVEAASPPSSSAFTAPSAADGPVTQLKGLGPKVAARLGELGITTVGQIAALDSEAAGRLDAQLGAFRGRMERDRWIEQARFLAAGDRAGFEAVFGRL